MIETKEQVLEKIMNTKKPACPYCGKPMSLWEVPDIVMGDGLGWGTPYLNVCFDNDCPHFTGGWDHIQENYAHHASTRCINYPGTKVFESMPVFSSVGGTGQIVDDDILAKREAIKEAIKKGFADLAECFTAKDAARVYSILADPARPPKVRMKAAEMMLDFGTLAEVEDLAHLKIGAPLIDKKILEAVGAIMARNHCRECPFCAEIIKDRASTCKHCNREVTGL
ncbi:MAG: zinc ribbon domain-containing protein [Proteobacteria bacterium]|nr:zinc ribbon domain-containing protein [Pseudomonadota bacterium]